MELDYKPIEFVDTTNLSRDEWLEYRKKGIGGSDAAAVMGLSPFKTGRELYYDKINKEPLVTPLYEKNWVQMRVGQELEDLVAEIFAKQTGYKVFKKNIMYQHPLYPFMLADVDFFVELPDGKIALLEIKTTNYFAIDHWKNNMIPIHYEIQGRHYMSVLNINQIFYACLYGNSEDTFLKRHMKRDLMKESELIFNENHFWNYNVLRKKEPPFVEDAKLVAECIEKYTPPPEHSRDIILDAGYEQVLQKYLHLKERKALLGKISRDLDKQMANLISPIEALIADTQRGSLTGKDYIYDLFYTPSGRASINSEQLEVLKHQYPDIYERFVTTSYSRSFKLSKRELIKNAAA